MGGVDPATLAELHELAETTPAGQVEAMVRPLRALTTHAEIIGYCYSDAKADGCDPLAAVELHLAAVKLDRSSRRAAARTLSKLKYPRELVDLVRGKKRLTICLLDCW